jgi:uncharacterized protein YecE (DUF72 family)
MTFNSLELNASWHSMMPDRNYSCCREIWQAKGARIAVKVNRYLTHTKKLKQDADFLDHWQECERQYR